MAIEMIKKVPKITNEREFTLFFEQIKRILSEASALGWQIVDKSTATSDDISEGNTNRYLTDERIDDRISAMLTAGNAISLVYDDTAGTLTIAVLNETIQDMIAAFLIQGNAITLTYDDSANTLAIAVDDEAIQDMLSSFLTGGVGISLTYADASNTLEIKVKRQANEAAAAAVSGIVANSGVDHIDRAAFNTALGTLVTEINAIKTTLNNVIAKLISAEVIAAP